MDLELWYHSTRKLVLCKTRPQVSWVWQMWFFTLLWFDIMYKQRHTTNTRINRLTPGPNTAQKWQQLLFWGRESLVSKFDFFSLFVLSKTVENKNFENGMILILKFAFKICCIYSTYKKLIFQSKAYLSRNRMQMIYLSAIIFDIYDATATWYVHTTAQIQILY